MLTMSARLSQRRYSVLSPEADVEPGAQGPRSLVRFIGLFDALAEEAADGLTLARLAATLQAPKSSLLSLLRPLVALGLLAHADGIYRLGPAIYHRAAAWLSARRFPQVVRPFMEELSTNVQETVVLGVLDRDEGFATYVEVLAGPRAVHYDIAAGTARPLHVASVGRVLAAFSSEATRRSYLGSVRLRNQLPDPQERRSLVLDLAQIRRQGVCFSADRHLPGLAGIAAPVFDASGKCIAALGVAGSTRRFLAEETMIRSAVIGAARRASGLAPLTKP